LIILFGLSMDYHVLILSRIREGRDRGLNSDRAVAEGITATAGVITSAAVVMVAVFAIFATLNVIQFKQLGVALAAAVLIDATIVRIVLLPSAMKILGPRSWYLPRWLRFIDRTPPIGQVPASASKDEESELQPGQIVGLPVYAPTSLDTPESSATEFVSSKETVSVLPETTTE
jgi:RND superfamily putative drug exporter